MMNQDQLAQLRADLLDADRMGEVLGAAVAREAADLPAELLEMLQRTYRQHAAWIIEQSESPIEAMLFNSLAVGCALYEPFDFMVRKVEGSALTYLERVRGIHAAMRHVQQQAKRSRGGKSVTAYIDWLVVAKKIDQEEADFWRGQEIGTALYGDAFHLIPQAKLPGMGARGKALRLDGLVYVPDRPDLLVAIECDGYEWHSNKESFTGDRVRDRALRKYGIQVLRFSGHEIHRDPAVASADLYDQLVALRKGASRPRRWASRIRGVPPGTGA